MKIHFVFTLLSLLVPLNLSAEPNSEYISELSKKLPASRLDVKISDTELASLPAQIQRYLKNCGVLSGNKAGNARIVYDVEIRGSAKQQWMQIEVEQYNIFTESQRFLYTDEKELPKGLNDASLLQTFGVVPSGEPDGSCGKFDKSGLVTQLNTMCLMVPVTLVDKRIKWEVKSKDCVKAVFTADGVSVSAELYFDDKGMLSNFITEDRLLRTATGEQIKYKWSTPVKGYELVANYRVVSKSEAIWHLPGGEFCCGKFELKDIEYNLETYKKEE